METILLLAHTETDGSLAKSTREALHVAADLHKALAGSKLVVGLVGEDVQSAANSIAACPATNYFGVAGKEFGQSRYATDAAAAEAICKAARATLVVAPATSRWTRALPGVAQRVGGRAETHVTGVSVDGGKIAVNRWYYRQRMEAVLTRAQRPWFMLIDPGSQAACQCGSGTAKIEAVAVNLTDACKRTTVTGIRARLPMRRPSGPMRNYCSSPARVGRRNKPTARRMCRRRRNSFAVFFKPPAHRWAAANRWWTRAAKARRCCRS